MESRLEKQTVQPLRTDTNWRPVPTCDTLSDQFEVLIEEHGGDPRSALGHKAISEAQARGGAWTPTWDAPQWFDPKRG